MSKPELCELTKGLHTTLLENGMLYELYPLATGDYERDMSVKRTKVLNTLYNALRDTCDILECSDEQAVEFLQSGAIEGLYEGYMAIQSGEICYINDVKATFEYN